MTDMQFQHIISGSVTQLYRLPIEPIRVAVLLVLLYPGHAQAFFGFGISKEEFYSLAAVAFVVVLILVSLTVYSIAKLVKHCKDKNSLRPAINIIAIFAVSCVIIAGFRANAKKRAAEYKRQYYEQLEVKTSEKPGMHRVETDRPIRTMPKPVQSPKPMFPDGNSVMPRQISRP